MTKHLKNWIDILTTNSPIGATQKFKTLMRSGRVNSAALKCQKPSTMGSSMMMNYAVISPSKIVIAAKTEWSLKQHIQAKSIMSWDLQTSRSLVTLRSFTCTRYMLTTRSATISLASGCVRTNTKEFSALRRLSSRAICSDIALCVK